MVTGDEGSARETISRPQFGLGAVLCAIADVALVLAYLRHVNSPTAFLGGAVVIVTAVLFGIAIGWAARRMADATYWAVVIAAAAYLSVVPETAYGISFHFAWSLTGALAGACCGTIAPGRWWWRTAAGTASAAAAMWWYVMLRYGGLAAMIFDVICAPVVGALVGLLIEVILWIERQRRIPRYLTACWLLAAVIVGNIMVPLMLGR